MTPRKNGQGWTGVAMRMSMAATLAMASCTSSSGDEPAGVGTELNNGQTPPGDETPTTGTPPNSNTGNGNGDSTGQQGNDNGDNSGDPGEAQACSAATTNAEATLEQYCAGCHGADSAGQGGFNTLLDVAALVRDGKVVPFQPEASPLFARLSGGTMPPQSVLQRPGPANIRAVEDWIACGAPSWGEPDPINPGSGTADGSPRFVDIDTRLDTILRDVRSFSNPTDRERLRYIDLSHLANAGVSNSELQLYREAVAFLLNSLSRGFRVSPPEPIDRDELIYRVDLRDYLWDEDTWRLLEDEYPYAVIYDQDSRIFPFDEVTADQIRRETETDIPYIQGDWFLSHASRPPLYNQILELPGNLAGLEAQLGIDIDDNIDDEQVKRAGFQRSATALNHRVVERHDPGGNQGGIWITYDFINNLDERNIFAEPLDFQEDGSQVIFNLDNGLQGYFSVDANGLQVDKAPQALLRDPLARDGAVEMGLSCMNCHQVDGISPVTDEILEFVLSTGDDVNEREEVAAIYPPKEELDRDIERDQDLYRNARSNLDIRNLSNTTLHTLDDTHLGVLDIRMAAGVLGIDVRDLQRALDASPQVFPPEILALRTPNGGVQRDAFEAVVGELVEALGLGDPLLTSFNN